MVDAVLVEIESPGQMTVVIAAQQGPAGPAGGGTGGTGGPIAASDISDSSAPGRAVLTATTTAAQRSAMGAAPAGTGVGGAVTATDAGALTQVQADARYALLSALTAVWAFKGLIDASTSPNYPAATAGWVYIASAAGKIGGASGKSVDRGDFIFCSATTSAGTDAAVGNSWTIFEHNLVGALLASNNLADVADVTAARANLGLGSVVRTVNNTAPGVDGNVDVAVSAGSVASTGITDASPAGRTMLTAADNAAQRTALGLGSAATQPSTAFAPAGTGSGGAVTAADAGALTQTQGDARYALQSALTSVWSSKGTIDASTNPNFPAATAGWVYTVSVAGKIGGASGQAVEKGDFIFCATTNAGGTDAAVGASWLIFEHNLVGALLAGNNLSDLANPATARTNLGLGSAALQAASAFSAAGAVRTVNNNAPDGAGNVTVAVASTLMTQVAHSTTIPLDGNKYMPRHFISGPEEYVLGAVAAGGQCKLALVADGVNIPTFGSGITVDPAGDTYSNVASRVNNLFGWSDGEINWVTIKDTGINVSVSVAATALTMSGPTAGVVGTATTNFTVTANGSLASSVVVTPAATNGGTFTPATVTLTDGARSANFTYTPSATGASSVSVTNNGALTAPTAIAVTVAASATAPGAPTGVVATAGDASASVAFVAPASNGGSAITGYTVTASTGQTGTGSASPINVPGLTNLTTVNFTVKAANSVGLGPASSASNSVTPQAAGGGSTTLSPLRLTNLLAATESGSAGAGWNYGFTGGSFYNAAAGASSGASIAGDGSFVITMQNVGGQYTPFLAIKSSSTLGDWTTTAHGILVAASGAMAATTGGAYDTANGTGATIANNATVSFRIRRVGTTLYAEYSTAASVNDSTTWTLLHTWSGASSGPLYAHVLPGGAGQSITNMRAVGAA